MATSTTVSDVRDGYNPGATTISLTPEQFERLYLSGTSSGNKQSSRLDLTSVFGNPAPLAVLGLVMSLTPLSCDLMGWRGAGVFGAASTGAYFFMGGFLMILGGVLEFFLGHTFLFTIFTGYGSFWLTYGATLQPVFGAYSTYSPDVNNPAAGLSTTGFTASFGFYLLFMAVFSFLACICALKTNLCLVILEFFLTLFFALLAAAFFQLGDGGSDASKVQTASGAFGFVSSIFGWYFFFALALLSVGSPIALPVWDLSRGASFRKSAKANGHHEKGRDEAV